MFGPHASFDLMIVRVGHRCRRLLCDRCKPLERGLSQLDFLHVRDKHEVLRRDLGKKAVQCLSGCQRGRNNALTFWLPAGVLAGMQDEYLLNKRSVRELAKSSL